MRIRFTKMQGAGNDFVVLDETRARLDLTPAQYRFIAHRQFGVGADQVLSVRPSPGQGIDFEYVIHNADGGQGYRVRFLPAWTDWPTDDAEADARRMNAWIEGEIRRNPAQYLWVHKRFKTRPPGEPSRY